MSVIEREPAEYDWTYGYYSDLKRHRHFNWRFECDADDCNVTAVFVTKEAAEWAERTHACPTVPERWGKFLSIAERYWLELDNVVDQLMAYTAKDVADQDPIEINRMRGRATGLAFALVLACTPYYADETAISRESMRRWKMRNQQMDWEPTPGFKYSPPPPGVVVRAGATYTQPHNSTGKAPAAKADPVEAGIKKLKAGAVEQIKHALGANMFSKEDLARVYGTTVAVIEAVAKGA